MDIPARIGALLAAVALTVAADGACQAAPSADYHWTKTPTGSLFEQYYPGAAMTVGVSGAVVIRCRIAARGGLEKCVVLGETPTGYGFAQAALGISTGWRMSAADAALHKGELFETTIRFKLDGMAPPIHVLPGDTATLVTFVKGDSPRTGRLFDCPSASDAARQCRSHPIRWLGRPQSDGTLALLAASDLSTGRTLIECKRAADGSLTDCGATGVLTPNSEAAALALAKVLRAPAQAEDRTSAVRGRILIEINWAEVRALRDQLTAADR